MQLTINSQVLAAELRLLNKVAPAKPAIQILGHLLLETDGDQLKLYATDMEIGLLSTVTATVHMPGRIALPAAHFLSLVEQFADGDVSIDAAENYTVIRCGAFKSRLQTYGADDFPDPPEPSGEASTFNGPAFQQLITRTRYAINASNSKSVLQGALLTLSGPAAAMAATDGKRLALATTGVEGAEARIIVPAKTLDVLESQTGVGEVQLTVGTRHLFFKMDERLLISRVFDGKFPKYEQIIPRDNDKQVTVGRVALAAALKRVRLVSPETKAVYFAFSAGALTLSSSSAEIGSADEDVQVAYEGPMLKVCVNGSFVLDFLEAASGQSVSLALKDAKSPLLLMDGADHLGVIMLMKA